MRLTLDQKTAIRTTVHAMLGQAASVRLFGSRTDDQRRGGDIDILVVCQERVEQSALTSARIGAGLQQALGERRIDVLIVAPNIPRQPIHRIALETGIEL